MANLSFKYYKTNKLLALLFFLISILTFASNMFNDFFLNHNIIFLKIPSVSAIIGITLILLDKNLHKYPLFWKYLISVPYVGGKYKGEIEFAYVDSDKKLIKGNKNCNMLIRQTCSIIKVDCEFYYEESESDKMTSSESFAELIEENEQRIKLFFPYRNSGIKINNEIPEALGYNELTYNKEQESFKGSYFSQRIESKGGSINVKKIR